MRSDSTAFLVAAFTMAVACRAEAQDFQWRGQLGSGQTIEVKGVNGDVRAVAGSGETEVTAVKHAHRSDPDEVKIEVVEDEGGVTICAVYPSDGRRENRCDDIFPSVAAHLFSDVRQVPKLEPSRPARLIDRQSARDVSRGRLFEIVLDFVGDVRVGGLPIAQSAQTADELTPWRHD